MPRTARIFWNFSDWRDWDKPRLVHSHLLMSILSRTDYHIPAQNFDRLCHSHFSTSAAVAGKICEGKANVRHVFKIADAKHALTNACKRLGFPPFSQRSLRRMFITRAIERGVDVKVIAEWQGHRDGGKLILDTYSHVNPVHSQRMAQLMTDIEPKTFCR